jgi:hypothetical protein
VVTRSRKRYTVFESDVIDRFLSELQQAADRAVVNLSSVSRTNPSPMTDGMIRYWSNVSKGYKWGRGQLRIRRKEDRNEGVESNSVSD